MNGSSLNNSERCQGGTSGSTTVIKYEQSSCLFCNEWFDSQTFTEHLIHCGQVLEQCPTSCNVFVPRIRMRAHLKECPRNVRKSASLERTEVQVDHRVQVLENEINTLRSVLNEEIRQRLHLITDVGNLRKQNQINDDWSRDTEENIKSLQKSLQEEKNQLSLEIEQCVQNLHYNYDLTQTLKADLRDDIDNLEKSLHEISLKFTEHQNLLSENIMKLEETILLTETANRDKFLEIDNFLQDINADFNAKIAVPGEACTVKSAAFDFELKGMKHVVYETEERCDRLEQLVKRIDNDIHHTMQLVSDLENHIATHQRLSSYVNTKGHLIWRIRDYSKKLEESKLYDTILHSAMFSNKPFGYSLRLDVYLNGKGSWKGRNMIACINVIAGEYDPLLSWPCRMQAEVIIRDQANYQKEVEDYVKVINVRKKSDDYIQNKQFFHIPHAVLSQRNYIKNDSIFLEVKVLKT